MTVLLNDVHSALNPTRMARVAEMASPADVMREVERARVDRTPVIAAGGRHAMGGQQFLEGGVLLDTRPLRAVRSLDRMRGTVEVEAGIQWPDLVGFLTSAQDPDDPERWTIVQKQSGADRFSLGGTVSANGHGRGLTLAPIVADVETMTVVDPDGRVRVVDRTTDPELFSLVGGGYGLFGVIATVTLRLARAEVLERVVEIRSVEGLTEAFAGRIAAGHVFGDFQFSIDEGSEGSSATESSRATARSTPRRRSRRASARSRGTTGGGSPFWPTPTVRRPTAHTPSTTPRRRGSSTARTRSRWPTTRRLSPRDRRCPRGRPSVDRDDQRALRAARAPRGLHGGRRRGAPRGGHRRIYGTVRLIERDTDTVLAWAREPWACVIVNLCTEHTPQGIDRSASAFRSLIDAALAHGGSYFPTYDRWATLEQLLAAHPRFPELVDAKRRFDPEGVFQSDWYRHYAGLLDRG